MALHRRRWRIQDALLKTAEKRGHKVGHPKDGVWPVWLWIGGERVDWSIYERDRLRKIPLTKAELKSPFNTPGRTWKQIAEPSGLFTITISAEYNGKRRLDEQPRRLFERRIDAIVDKLEAAAARTVEGKKWQADFERRQRRRAYRRKIAGIEADRWERLRELSAAWNEAERLRAFVSTVEQRMKDLTPRPPRVDAWLGWARWRIDDLDPLAEDTEAVFAKVIQRPRPMSEYEREFGEEEDDEE